MDAHAQATPQPGQTNLPPATLDLRARGDTNSATIQSATISSPWLRAELPRDLQGDVVIEVTIDSQGNVVETKIVQAIGHGIDEKIEATLRRWHYQPATLDGTPVASRHDVHFHFPS